MAAKVDETSPRIVFERQEMNPTWHADIYRVGYKLENIEKIEPGKMCMSETVRLGGDGFKISVKLNPAFPDQMGLFLYKVLC